MPKNSAGKETKAQGGLICFNEIEADVNMCEIFLHGCGLVESCRQLGNAEVDDDQRHSTLLLVPLLLGRLLDEEMKLEKF